MARTTQTFARRVLFASPWWHSDIVNGVMRHAARLGWHVDLQTCLSGKIPKHWVGDGIITQLGGDLNALQRLLDATGCPAVSLNNNYPRVVMPRVSLNHSSSGQLAAAHLLDLGFRNFGFYVAGFKPDSPPERLTTFTHAIEQAGYELSPLLWTGSGEPGGEAWQARHRWLRGALPALDKPIGIYAYNDQAAVEVIEACLAESITVPDQVAVLGTLNMPLFRHCTPVGLSSIDFDFDQMTAAACDQLDRMMAGEPAPDEQTQFAPTGVIIRQSTDTLAAQSPVVARAVRFMLDNYGQDIDVAAILQAAGGSRAGLFNAFQADMGRPPGEVLLGIRIERAKRMLTSTDAKVYEVAGTCGFGEPVNLHRAFKQHVGKSPNGYRKAVRQNQG